MQGSNLTLKYCFKNGSLLIKNVRKSGHHDRLDPITEGLAVNPLLAAIKNLNQPGRRQICSPCFKELVSQSPSLSCRMHGRKTRWLT